MEESETLALQKYLRLVYSKDPTFREMILDLSVNMTFIERFYLSSNQEKNRFNKTGIAGTENEIVRSRISSFFSTDAELGNCFLRYMETGDKSIIGEEMFDFIAAAQTEDEHGFVTLDPESIELCK
ncbi:hypothetical protein ACO0LO_08420 [Undibacterium sp. TJN25]|uniref:hypothetical protein n=1 Tax=Undibacterium sp. TJN25 TaxID=3413056 RepID=UPI003BF1CE5F